MPRERIVGSARPSDVLRRRTARWRVLLAVVSGLVAAAVAGCSQTDRPGAADCDAQVRVAGVVYTAVGTTRRPATWGALAEEAACHDVGEDAAGSVFTDDPSQVRTWTFEGEDPMRVLGVRIGSRTLRVFVADDLAAGERRRVLAGLGGPEGQRARSLRSRS